MFIRDSKRFNIYASATIDGVTYPNFLSPELRGQLGITEIADPAPPEDYSEETYYRTEQDDAPYVVFTKKSAEQLKQQEDAKSLTAAKQYLLDTDYKMLPDYIVKPDGEPLVDIIAKRADARTLVRELETELQELLK